MARCFVIAWKENRLLNTFAKRFDWIGKWLALQFPRVWILVDTEINSFFVFPF
jgi:hypothetical protein